MSEAKTQNEESPKIADDSTKVEGATSEPSPAGSSALSSSSDTTLDSTAETVDEAAALEEIEKELHNLDPEFANELAAVASVVVEPGVEIETYDPDKVNEEGDLDPKQSPPFIYKIKRRIKAFFNGVKTYLVHVVTYQIPELAKWIFLNLKSFLLTQKQILTNFFALPLKTKLLFFVFFLFVVCGGGFLYYFWKVNPLSKPTEMFITNLETLATDTASFNYKLDMEPFFYNFRLSQNIFTTERLVVNLRPSPNSGPNPMAAVELFLSGTSADVVIEIKDREAEMKDVMLRAIEEFTFDDIISQQGKQNLTERIARSLNTVLTKGKVKSVYYKSVIFKP